MSNLEATSAAVASTETTRVDVLIVGAGISGISAAWHLQHERPGTTFLVLDALDGHGGTWWTHRYPGVRSDSDLFTFGYKFKPWLGQPIATADQILSYLGEVIDENGLDEHIRYRHQILSASWSTQERCWTVSAKNLSTGEDLTFTCGFLWMCQGYYRHQQGYRPEWPGFDHYEGDVLHPQEWPEQVDLAGKRVVVIGSGATAATIIPAIADEASHVTMLQRSPTFFAVRPNSNELADTLRSLDIPAEWTHEIVRQKVMQDMEMIMTMSDQYPDVVRQLMLDSIKPHLPEGFDVMKHFNPSYRPWQQRVAVLPDGDMFKAIKAGKVDVVTDTIETFTPDGIQISSGEVLEADVVITATGFDLCVLGDLDLMVDGQLVDPADTVTWRGIMFTGLPNLATVFGYFRASWTLRADLISEFVCRLLDHMDAGGAAMVVPTIPEADADMPLGPWVDPETFNPGYLTRSLHLMPRQGSKDPWLLGQQYSQEKVALPAADLDDGTLTYS